jgi:hypothetical protein
VTHTITANIHSSRIRSLQYIHGYVWSGSLDTTLLIWEPKVRCGRVLASGANNKLTNARTDITLCTECQRCTRAGRLSYGYNQCHHDIRQVHLDRWHGSTYQYLWLSGCGIIACSIAVASTLSALHPVSYTQAFVRIVALILIVVVVLYHTHTHSLTHT